MDFDKAIVEEFVSEALEHLETVEEDLMSLESASGGVDDELVNKVFRAVHTVKGTSGFLGYTNLAALAHVGETMLSLIRSGEILPESRYIDALLMAVDKIRTMLDDLDNSDKMDVSTNIQILENLLNKEVSGATKESLEADAELSDSDGQLVDFKVTEYEMKDSIKDNDYIFLLKFNLSRLASEKGRDPVVLMNELEKLGEIIEARMEHPSADIRKGLPDGHLLCDVLLATKQSGNTLCSRFELAPENVIEVHRREETVQNEKTEVKQVDVVVETIVKEDVVEETGTEIAESKRKWDGKDRRGEREKQSFDGAERRKDTIRLKLGVLDELMRLAGELVLVRNQQVLSLDKSDPITRANAQRLDVVTTELQETIMATRMQPIGNLFNKFNRVVRDLGKKLEKRIDLKVEGSEVELDNTILEALSDPMTHLVRNCCDHGIELPENRQAAGKPPVGNVILRAYHESGQVNIEIKDDGKGVDCEAVKRKLREKGLKTEQELAMMTDSEIVNLILLPGFSTAEVLSDVSGRGVGMDVVKSSIEGLGGTIEIRSAPGKGSLISMRLPLTLAIIPCLVAQVGDYRYAIPQVNLEELVCLYDDDVRTKIESAGNKEVYRLRDHLLPLVRLEEVLKRDEPFTEEVRAGITEQYRLEQERIANEHQASGDEEPYSQSLNFAVLKVGSNRFGLIVDKVIGTEEIVVKPMHPAVKHLDGYGGATVMGDGQVALILDVQAIARYSGTTFDKASDDDIKKDIKRVTEFQTALLFTIGGPERFAIPLPLIKRIESIKLTEVDRIGDKEYITIDGVSTLLLRLDKYLNVSPCREVEEMKVILPKHVKNPFGIMVTELVDTVDVKTDLNVDGYMENGLLGTSILKGKATLFLDIDTLIGKAEPEWFRESQAPVFATKAVRVLFAEDTSFFRNLVLSYLNTDGYNVISAADGQEALDYFNAGEFDIIVSDLEMPVMDGFDFMKNVRAGSRHNDIPSIALTALTDESGYERAKEAGFDKYEVKIDKDRLLQSIRETLEKAVAV